MPGAVRKGDANDAGGKVIADFAPNIFIDGRPAAQVGSLVEPHPNNKPPHIIARCSTSSNAVIGNNKGLVYIGCKDTCGHTRVEGSATVIIGA